MRYAMLLLLPLLAAPTAQAAEPAGRPARETCLDNKAINSWAILSDRQILVTLGANRRYRVTLGLAAETSTLHQSAKIGFAPSGNGQLCPRNGYVIVDGRAIRVDSIEQIPSN